MKIKFSNTAAEIVSLISFLTEEERRKVTKVDYDDAYASQSLIREIQNFIFPNIDSVEDDEVFEYDLSQINYCLSGARKYRFPREIFESKFTEVESLHVPYFLVIPDLNSISGEGPAKFDLSEEECIAVVKFLEKNKSYGLVPNCRNFESLKSDWIIHKDLTFLEILEYLKKARLGYIGSANIIAVLAAKKFDKSSLYIKVSPQLKEGAWFKFFFSPQIEGSFLYLNLNEM